MFKNQQLQQNFTSGLLVSFIALPLCIAISLASSFPILSGIFTAIIGGILVSQISGARLSINGPAAGMIVVILEAVEKLGAGDVILGYKYTLAAILCAALMQLATSFTSLPNLLRKFPESIIRGMMVAIGLIVILKQLFVLFGFKTPKVSLLQLFAEIPHAFLGANLITLGIGTFAIVTIFVWKKYLEKHQLFRLIPVYLFVIVCSAGLAYIAHLTTSHFFLRNSMASPANSLFIEIPHSIFSAFSLPDFSQFFSRNLSAGCSHCFNPLLHFIPLCVLAAMLIIIGINLINFPLLKEIFYHSKIDFIAALTVVFFHHQN